ncbi:MAG: hypothetical protein HKO57_02665 [Akkermansiaceae bacterium]|nr:hypothetical protein [Akkermansiaceae bacterium]
MRPAIACTLLALVVSLLLPAGAAMAGDRRAAILYSATSRDNYFDQFSYYQVYMSAQHQCTMAGIPFDLLDEAALNDDANLAAYDVLIIPHFVHVNAANRPNYITELGQAAANGLNIISADWLMGYDAGNQPFADAGLANESLVGVMWTNFNGPVVANLKAADPSHPALPGYAPNETILSYAQVWADEFSPSPLAVPAASTAYATLFISGQSYTAVNAIQTAAGNRNVHFTNAQIMLDSNLLWSAIHWALYGTEPPVALRTGRQRSLFFARNDMDQSMFPDDLPSIEVPLLGIITDWKTNFDFVGSYYLNVGNDPAQGEFTDWAVSGPLYQDYRALGSEIGTHSYTHPDDIKTLNASQLEFEFKDSKNVIAANMGIAVTGGAVPGNPESPAEIEIISQWLPYLSGRSAVSDSNFGLTTAYGHLRPGFPMFYNCLNISPDFTLVGYLGLTAAEAAQTWRQEVDNLHQHAPLPVVHWLWHDYGPVESEPGFTRGMYESMISHAVSLDTEFLTGHDFFERNQAFRNCSLDVTHLDADTIRAVVSNSGVGKFSLQLGESETITSVDDWYAYDGHKVFLPAGGGTFTIRRNGVPGTATRITRLPPRAELISLTGDGRTLGFSFRGKGRVTVAVPPGSGFQVTGADAFAANGARWDLLFDSEGLHTATVVPDPSSIRITSTALAGTAFTIGFAFDPNFTAWKLLGSPDPAAGVTTDLTPQATITESPAGSGNYRASIDVAGFGPRYFFRIGFDGAAP